jgi:hypothetical protein
MFNKLKKSINAKVFEFTYDDATILEDNRWAVDVNFHLIGEDQKKVHDQKIYTLVCSPEFLKDPTPEYKDYIDEKTITQPYLNKQKIESMINLNVDQLNQQGFLSWEDYYNGLERYYYIDD